MGEDKTGANVTTKSNLDGDRQGGGPGGSSSGKPGKVKRFASIIEKACKMKVGRFLVLLAGLAAFIGGLVIWLAPVGSTSATENATTTVIDVAGHKTTTVVKKNTSSKSDTMLVALFTAGVGLLAVGALWDRIREVGFGNLSIKLAEATVEQQEIPLAATKVEQLESFDSTGPTGIAKEVRNLPKDLMLGRIDLDRTWWAPTNLKFYVLMLANHRPSVKVLIFTGVFSEQYLGIAPVAWLSDRVKVTDPALFAAYQTVKEEPIASEFEAGQLGGKFYDAVLDEDKRYNNAARLDEEDENEEDEEDEDEDEEDDEPDRQSRSDESQVDWGWLNEFAGNALIVQSIEADIGQALSRQQQLEILAFPLVFVPITNRGRRLEAILDKHRIAKTLGFSAVDFRTSTT